MQDIKPDLPDCGRSHRRLESPPLPSVHRQASAEDERAQFEAWANDQGFVLQRVVRGDDYQDLRTQGPWDAWRARAEGAPSASQGRQASAGQEGEREAFIAWLGHSFPHVYDVTDAAHLWDKHHVAALAWQRRATLSTAAPESGWRPIETAPKGAKGVAWMQLAWGPEEDRKTGYGMRIEDKFYAAATFFCPEQEKQFELREVEVQPTHWQPLPAAPTAGETP